METQGSVALKIQREPLKALIAAAEGLLPAGQPLLLAVSGGRDSMTLLHAMVSLDLWQISVCTVDHGLHDSSAVAAEGVIAFCARLGVPCTRVDVRPLADGRGLEAAARDARLGALESVAEGRLIVTAHSADDQAETVLMRLGRSAGLRGLAGIPERRDAYRRPWLTIERGAIAALCRAAQVPVFEDPSNATLAFDRNRVRAAVLPALTAALGPSWVAGAAISAENLANDFEASEWLFERTFSDRWRSSVGEAGLDCVGLRVPVAVQRGLLKRLLDRGALAAGLDRLQRVRGPVESVFDLVEQGVNGRVASLGASLSARFQNGVVWVGRAPRTAPRPDEVQVIGVGEARFGAGVLQVELLSRLPVAAERGSGCLAFSASPFPWTLRPIVDADRYRPVGAPGRKRVSRQLIDAKVARHRRSAAAALLIGDRIAWVAGLRTAEWSRAQADEPVYRLTWRWPDAPADPPVLKDC